MTVNRQIIVAERPRYVYPTSNCFRMANANMPRIGEGEVLLQTSWLAMESMLYSRLRRVSSTQADPIPLKSPMIGPGVGRVVESKHPRFKVGDLASGLWNWQDFNSVDGRRLRNLDFGPERPSLALGAHGTAGFGAYIAIEEMTQPRQGETVLVGTALGSLGHISAQIAKLKGARVVGIAGSAERCQIAVEKLGYDACVNRKSKGYAEQLAAACPNGIDAFVETVGGEMLNAVLPLMNLHSRIAAVGVISTTSSARGMSKGKFQNSNSLLFEIINKRISVRGMITYDHVKGRVKEFDELMKGWIAEGKIKPMEDVFEGFEKAPEALQGVFEGKNRGCRLVRVADE